MKNLMKSWNKGFTLIELLASIVILGILAVIVTPLAVKYLSKAQDDIAKVQEAKIEEAAKIYYDDCVNGDGTEVADLEEGHSNVCDEFEKIIEYHNGESTNANDKNTCVTLEKLVSLGYIKPIYIEGGLYSANIYIATESKSDTAYNILTNRCFGFMPGEASSELKVIDETEYIECEDDDEECKLEASSVMAGPRNYTSTVDMTYFYNYNRTCEYVIDPSTNRLSTYDDSNKTTDEIRQECQNGV